MKRTKQPTKKKTELQKYLSTLYQVSKYFENCNELYSKYEDLWQTTDNDTQSIEAIKTDMKKGINRFIRAHHEKDVVDIAKKFNPQARRLIKPLIKPQYKGFFETDYKGLPNDFVAPTPFLCLNKREGKFIELSQPLERKYGLTTMEIKGTALTAEDAKTTLALLLIKRMKKTEINRKNIYFTTTMTEIGQMLQKANPYDKKTKEAIWNSLERLRGCVITLKNKNGKRMIGGILDGAVELEEDSSFEIEIFMDKNFVDLIDEGYPFMKPEIYFKLPSREANIYYFLMRQKSFNQYGRLSNIGIRKMYELTGLGGLQSEQKSMANIRFEIKTTLNKLMKRGLIGRFEIERDKVNIMPIKQGQEKGEVASSHSGGRGTNQYKSAAINEPNSSKPKTLSEKPVNSKYYPLAEKLATIIENERGIRCTVKQEQNWSNDIRLLVEENKVSIERIENALSWYAKNINDRFTPQIESGRSLREKFIKLEEAMNRKGKGKSKVTIGSMSATGDEGEYPSKVMKVKWKYKDEQTGMKFGTENLTGKEEKYKSTSNLKQSDL
ncbi:MAG: hypothetical protein K9I68_00315 [Bacteroidales bacterium]|nr:hypothetical protein [Bacteroidales bacterium]MCF8336422.1 hypothetical protein [Bacteroidales bacterium]